MNNENKVVRAIYTLILGAFLAVFVGIGINTFYVPPKAPAYPNYSTPTTPEKTSEQLNAEQNDYQKKYDEYNENVKPYSRNVSITALVASVVFVIVSIKYEKKLGTLADGFMFGGLFTLGYAIIRAFMSGSDKYKFVSITVSLLVVLYVGYHRFVRTKVTPTKAKAKG